MYKIDRRDPKILFLHFISYWISSKSKFLEKTFNPIVFGSVLRIVCLEPPPPFLHQNVYMKGIINIYAQLFWVRLVKYIFWAERCGNGTIFTLSFDCSNQFSNINMFKVRVKEQTKQALISKIHKNDNLGSKLKSSIKN